MVPMPHLLNVTLTLDEVLQTLDSSELRIAAEALELDAAGQWSSCATVEYSVTATFGQANGLQAVLRIKPALLGFAPASLDEDEAEPDCVLSASAPGNTRYQRATVVSSTLSMTDGRLRFEAAGTWPGGKQFSLKLEGAPTLVSVKVLVSEGRAQAERLLETTWAARGDGVLSQFETEALLTLNWQPREVAEALEVERIAEAKAHDEAEARAQREAIDQARAARGPVLAPTAGQPLFAQGRLHTVERAELSVRRQGTKVLLEFEVRVDEHSGEDSALAPRFAMVAEALDLPAIGQTQVLDLRDAEVEGWFGNDAPELVEHRLSLRRLSETALEVDWSASYDDWQTKRPEPLRFLGRVSLRQG